MKKILNIINEMLLACLVLCGCQDVKDFTNTIATVKTDNVEKYTGRYAYLSGSVNAHAYNYFLVSTSQDMSDAAKVSAGTNKNESMGMWNCFAEIDDLAPGTTYYVTLCASDGVSESRGNVVSFTTNEYLSIENVNVNDMDGGSSTAVEGQIGTYLLSGWTNNYTVWGNYANMPTKYSGIGYSLPYDIELTQDTKVYAYYPYTYEVFENQIDVYANDEYYKQSIDYMYGSSNVVNASETKANIAMYHALSKVTFSITKAADDEDEEVLTKVSLYSFEGNVLKFRGLMNVFTGDITPWEDLSGEAYDKTFDNERSLTTDEATTIDYMLIPVSFEDYRVRVTLTVNGRSIETTLPASTWEKGKHYTYQLTVDKDALEIGNIEVEEWVDSEEGTITIKQE